MGPHHCRSISPPSMSNQGTLTGEEKCDLLYAGLLSDAGQGLVVQTIERDAQAYARDVFLIKERNSLKVSLVLH